MTSSNDTDRSFKWSFKRDLKICGKMFQFNIKLQISVKERFYRKNSFKTMNSKSMGFERLASPLSCNKALTNMLSSSWVTLAPIEYGISGTAYLKINNKNNLKSISIPIGICGYIFLNITPHGFCYLEEVNTNF